MWPDRVSNQGPLTYNSGALPTRKSEVFDTRRGVSMMEANKKSQKLLAFVKLV